MANNPTRRKIGLIAMRALLAAELAVFLVIVTVWLYPQSLPAAIAIARQDSVCPLGDVWDGGPLRVLLNKEATRIREGSKLVETDEAGFEYWETPEGKLLGSEGQRATPSLSARAAVRRSVWRRRSDGSTRAT